MLPLQLSVDNRTHDISVHDPNNRRLRRRTNACIDGPQDDGRRKKRKKGLFQFRYVFDRSERREKRPEKEIGFSAVRGGTIVGDHDVIFAGTDEVVTFSHSAYSKAVFGKGAIQAAKFLKGKAAGLYDMSDVIGLE